MTERENITSEQLAEWKEQAAKSHSRLVRTAVPALVAEVERLRAEKIELNEGILELQRMLCARDGVPMPSERPLVDKLREEIERLQEAAGLAETIIRQIPQNGKYWDTVSRFWAARSALPDSPAPRSKGEPADG